MPHEEAAIAFVDGYGSTWEAWDLEGFTGLFTDDTRYVAHSTEETVSGAADLLEYVRKEQQAQGQVSVKMGQPVIGEDRVVAEFWVKSTGPDGEGTITGCFIARLEPETGKCSDFREYWFEIPGHFEAFEGWGT